MSTLSSSSTYAQIKASYLDNASYEEDGSTSKAAAFITACRMLIHHPSRTRVGSPGGAGQEMEFDLAVLQAEMKAAQEWKAANDQSAGSRTTYGDFANFRY